MLVLLRNLFVKQVAKYPWCWGLRFADDRKLAYSHRVVSKRFEPQNDWTPASTGSTKIDDDPIMKQTPRHADTEIPVEEFMASFGDRRLQSFGLHVELRTALEAGGFVVRSIERYDGPPCWEIRVDRGARLPFKDMEFFHQRILDSLRCAGFKLRKREVVVAPLTPQTVFFSLVLPGGRPGVMADIVDHRGDRKWFFRCSWTAPHQVVFPARVHEPSRRLKVRAAA